MQQQKAVDVLEARCTELRQREAQFADILTQTEHSTMAEMIIRQVRQRYNETGETEMIIRQSQNYCLQYNTSCIVAQLDRRVTYCIDTVILC